MKRDDLSVGFAKEGLLTIWVVIGYFEEEGENRLMRAGTAYSRKGAEKKAVKVLDELCGEATTGVRLADGFALSADVKRGQG